VGLEINGIHQLPVYVGGMNLLGDNVDTVNKNEKIVIDASKEVGPEVNEEKFMLLSCYENGGKNQDTKRASRYFENVAQFKHLRTRITNQNLFKEEIKRI
jgi:hypothetical protein